MAPVCRFWLKGQCRYGSACNFEHPPRENARNDNRFAALQPAESGSSKSYASSRSVTPASRTQRMRNYLITDEGIAADLSNESPQWILSAYSPGVRSPTQLFGGPEREQSFEERRLRYYEARALGNPGLAVQEDEQLLQKARAQMQNAVNNIRGAVDYILAAESEHPNRIDFCQDPKLSEATKPTGQHLPVTGTGTVFGQPTMLEQPSTPFGGGGSTIGFMDSGGSTPFEPFAAAQTSFSSQAPSTTSNPFSADQLQQQPNPFGRSEQSSLNKAFQAAPNAQSSFHTPAFSQAASIPNPFKAQTNPFGGVSQTQHSPFSQPSSSSTLSHVNPFSAGSATNSNVYASQSSQPHMNGSMENGNQPSNSSSRQQQLSSYATMDAQQRLTMFKGKPVVYRDGEVGMQNRDGGWEKIWFPEGGPHLDEVTEAETSKYDKATAMAFARVRETGSFENGLPLLPPKREWCRWDF